MFEFESRLELSLKVLILMESQNDEYVKTSKVCLKRNLKKVQRFANLKLIKQSNKLVVGKP